MQSVFFKFIRIVVSIVGSYHTASLQFVSGNVPAFPVFMSGRLPVPFHYVCYIIFPRSFCAGIFFCFAKVQTSKVFIFYLHYRKSLIYIYYRFSCNIITLFLFQNKTLSVLENTFS